MQITPIAARDRVRRRVAFVGLSALFLLPAAFTLAMASPGGSRPTSSADVRTYRQMADADLAGAGQVIYLQRCSSCHGPTGQGTDDGPFIVGLGPANYSFQMTTGRMPLAQPGTQGIRRPPSLTPAQIAAVIAYLTSLDPSGVPIPNVDPAAGNLSQGSASYLLNCAPCHSASGDGGAVGPQVAPGLHQATATQIGEAVRIGPGTMPVFDERTIPDRELNSLARYVLYLRDPTHPGGIDLGFYGPIVEGFVALVIGLAAIVVVSRYIGARSS